MILQHPSTFPLRLVWIIGPSGSGKSTLAQRLAEELPGVPIIETGRHARAESCAGDGYSPETLTLHATEMLRSSPRHYSRKIGDDLRNRKGRTAIVCGVRNPIDFCDHFDPRGDVVIFVPDPPVTAFEAAGVEAVRSVARFHLDVGLISPWQILEKGSCTRAGQRVTLTPIACRARGSFLGAEDDVPGSVIAVEMYAGESPTLTFMSETGHLYCYLPPHAFGEVSCSSGLSDHVDVNCPHELADVADLRLSGPGWCRIGACQPMRWERYVATIDWPRWNVLIHLVQLPGGAFAFSRVSRFQVGGDAWAPPGWMKSRDTWRVK